MKIIVGIAFLGIVISLAAAGMYMLRGPDAQNPEQPKGNHMVRALTFRIGISVALFLLILALWYLGSFNPLALSPVNSEAGLNR